MLRILVNQRSVFLRVLRAKSIDPIIVQAALMRNWFEIIDRLYIVTDCIPR